MKKTLPTALFSDFVLVRFLNNCFCRKITAGKPRLGLLELDHTAEKKKEIKEHAGVRKGLEAPLPENATADVLLSLPQYFSCVTSSFCYQRQR
jgi:hypothetical protein